MAQASRLGKRDNMAADEPVMTNEKAKRRARKEEQ